MKFHGESFGGSGVASSEGWTASPIRAAATTIRGSGSFLKRQSKATVTSANAAVTQSVIERWPMTITAPVIAPMAAAVTPSTKATIAGRLPCFLK